uniref:PDZ domain-containing protein n=1 Tax=Angiostrongylus cantonensis TaxID=6313 RepID=A0A0K0DC60_ANGCA
MEMYFTETDNEYIIRKPHDELRQIRDTRHSATKKAMTENLPPLTMEEKRKYDISQEKTDTVEYRTAYQKLLTFSKVAHHDICTDSEARSELEFSNNIAPMSALSPSKLKAHHNTLHPLRDEWYIPSNMAGEPHVEESIKYKRGPPRRLQLTSQTIDQVETLSPAKLDEVTHDYVLTQEEPDHIAWIQRLAEETLEAKPIDALPTAEDEPISSPIQMVPSVIESEQTSGAHQGASSELQSQSEEVAIYERSSPLLKNQHHIFPTLQGDQNVHSPTTAGEPYVDQGIIYKRQPPRRPPLPSQSIDQVEALPHAKPDEVTDEYILTQKELDHIAWIQHPAEEKSLDAIPIDRRESKEESSPLLEDQHDISPPVQEDQNVFSSTSAGEPYVDQTIIYKREPPRRPPLPSQSFDQVEYILTQEELDHIASIQRLAEESLEAKPMDALPTAEDERMLSSRRESKEESEPTSGADQGSPAEEAAIYERSSPLLEDQHDISPPVIVYKREPSHRLPLPLQSDYILTQEELDHIAWIHHLAEESLDAKPMDALPTAEDEPISSSIQMESEPTSGADQGSPAEEAAIYERSSPLLEDQQDISPPVQEDRDVPSPTTAGGPYVDQSIVYKREPSHRLPLPLQSNDQVEALPPSKPDEVADDYILTQEEASHIACVQGLTEETLEPKPMDVFPVAAVERTQASLATAKDALPIPSLFQMSASLNSLGDVFEAKVQSKPSSVVGQAIRPDFLSQNEGGVFCDNVAPQPCWGSSTDTEKPRDYLLLKEPKEKIFSKFKDVYNSFESHLGRSCSSELLESNFFNDKKVHEMSRKGTAEQKRSASKEHRNTRLMRRSSIGIAMRSSDKPSILNRSTSVSYTSSTVHVVPVEHSFFSARRDTVKLSNIGAQNAVLSAKNGVSVQRRSKVQIIYTDHSLRESQSSQTDNISEQGDLFEDSMSENIEASTLWPETVALGDNDACGVNDEKVIHRSHSDVVQDVALSAEPVRSSLSSNCFAAMCSEHHATLNAYELCEQHSFTESKDLLCNVDFLCRLNFAAHRISEDIAEEAGRALRIHFRDQLNPRARYFKTSSLDDDLQSEYVLMFFPCKLLIAQPSLIPTSKYPSLTR